MYIHDGPNIRESSEHIHRLGKSGFRRPPSCREVAGGTSACPVAWAATLVLSPLPVVFPHLQLHLHKLTLVVLACSSPQKSAPSPHTAPAVACISCLRRYPHQPRCRRPLSHPPTPPIPISSLTHRLGRVGGAAGRAAPGYPSSWWRRRTDGGGSGSAGSGQQGPVLFRQPGRELEGAGAGGEGAEANGGSGSSLGIAPVAIAKRSVSP